MNIKLLLFVAVLMACACGSGNSKNVNPDSNDASTVAALNEGFDFEKYHQAIIDKAELHFFKSDGEIRLVKFALIDIDHDGKPEVWVKGDDGENYQGVYAIDGDDVALLASGDTCTDLIFYKDSNAVGYDSYWDNIESVGATIVKDSRPAGSYSQSIMDPNDEATVSDCFVDNNPADAAACDAFSKKLGVSTFASEMENQVTWHPVN